MSASQINDLIILIEYAPELRPTNVWGCILLVVS
jgi:hypothetical protein